MAFNGFVSYIGLEPVPLSMDIERNIGGLGGDVMFVRKSQKGDGIEIDAGCEKHAGNVVHVIADSKGKLEKVMCPSYGGDGKCLLIGDKVCPNKITTSGLPKQEK